MQPTTLLCQLDQSRSGVLRHDSSTRPAHRHVSGGRLLPKKLGTRSRAASRDSGRCSWFLSFTPGSFGIHSIDSRTDRICVCLQSRDSCRTRHYMSAGLQLQTAAAPRIPTLSVGSCVEMRRVASSCVKQLSCLSVLVNGDDDSSVHIIGDRGIVGSQQRVDNGPIFGTGNAVLQCEASMIHPRTLVN